MSETKKLPAEKAPAAAGAEDAKMVKLLDKLITHQKRVEAATLAAAIATNRGTPLSMSNSPATRSPKPPNIWNG